MNDDIDEFDDDDEDQANAPRGLRKALKATAAENKTLKQRLEALERREAFTEAGVDRTSPLGKFFMESWNGALDPDAIKAKWSEIAGTGASTQSTAESPVGDGGGTPPKVSDEFEADARAVQQLRNPGQNGAGTRGPTPIEQARAVTAQGQSLERAAGVYLAAMLGGDQRQ